MFWQTLHTLTVNYLDKWGLSENKAKPGKSRLYIYGVSRFLGSLNSNKNLENSNISIHNDR